uniref:Si:ch211-213a13.2 n=1 Tax=Sinocyclocheilus grahami TaxID=75366 RepID=A0A672LBH3_SINGR
KDLDMSNNNLQDSGVKKLQNGLENTNYKSCSALAAVLGSDTNLKELNMNNNNLQDSGVKLLCSGLKSVKCELEILRLNNNSITEEGCAALNSAFNLNPSNLIELDLSGNKLGNSGIEKISPLLTNIQCRLKKLRLRCCDMKHKGCSALTSALKSNPSHLRELSLSENKLGDSGVKNLIIVLFLSVFSLCECSITEEQCLILTSALKSNPSHLRELDLSENKIENKGVNYLCDVLKDSLCKLERLRLNDCNLTDKSCSALATVLGSDTSLKELNLSNNNLQDSGVKLLCTGLKNIQCKLEILRLNNCELTEKSCSVLATVLSSKTILKEINLNNSHLLDSGVKEICEGLKNPVCELKILKLLDCSITEAGYEALASALRSNPSHLIELDLTGNDPGQSGVKQLNDLLQDPNCQLKTLR